MDPFKTSSPIEMSEENFRLLRDFIYEQSGIFFADNKKAQLEGRLTLRLKANNIDDYDQYYYKLRYEEDAGRELNLLFDSVSTNETSFFRSMPQIQAFKEQALPDIMAAKRDSKSIRIWSAGCSTGEEPYTLAIVLKEALGDAIGAWQIEIMASDISQKAIVSANSASYNEYSLRSTPDEIRERYFTPQEGGLYRINEDIKQLVTLKQQNFSDTSSIQAAGHFDVIFCRNVLIYFNDELRKSFVSQLHQQINPGGYLFIGHSESLHKISRAFKLVHFPGALGYKKD